MTRLTDAVLREGVDDWVPFRTVHALARTHTSEQDERSVRRAAIAAVRELVTSGLVDVGVVTGAGFSAWSSPLSELAGLAPAYFTADASADDEWGFRFWLSNTPAGDRSARETAAE